MCREPPGRWRRHSDRLQRLFHHLSSSASGSSSTSRSGGGSSSRKNMVVAPTDGSNFANSFTFTSVRRFAAAEHVELAEHLEREGYAVARGVLSSAECALAHHKLWAHLEEKSFRSRQEARGERPPDVDSRKPESWGQGGRSPGENLRVDEHSEPMWWV